MLQTPDLSRTVARLRAKSPPVPENFEEQIAYAARKLDELPGDFIFVGASPIRIGLKLMTIAPDRDCRFVAFSGGWMRQQDYNGNNGTFSYGRNYNISLAAAETYMRDQLATFGQHDLRDRQSPLNIVDCFSSGCGQASFADLLVSFGERADHRRHIAGKLNLVPVTSLSDDMFRLKAYRWTTLGGTVVQAPCDPVFIGSGSWNVLISKSGTCFHEADPRLTEPYRPQDWHQPPAPAPASNLAAFRRAAQGIAPERLRKAFGPAYDVAFEPR